MAKLTKTRIDAHSLDSGRKILWDDDPKGFGLKINRSGKKVFILKYRNQYGRQRKLTLGIYGTITLEQARKLAKENLVCVAHGEDPADDKLGKRTSPTMQDLLERYLEEHSKVNNKEATYRGNKYFVNRYLIPELGKDKVQAVTRTEIYALQQKLYKQSKNVANNAISILSKAFNLAEIWGWRADYTNPCRHVKKFPVPPKQRFLSKEEFKRLGDVLDFMEKAQLESPSVVAAIRLLMHTGCRLNEIVKLKWSYIDFNNQCIHLPDSKTGAKTVYYSKMVDTLLRGIQRQPDNAYVLAGSISGKPVSDLEKPWRRIRKDAGLEDVRIHDLRHSFASMAAASGMSLPIIGAMLGHKQPQTTMQYVHLLGDPMREAANMVSSNISDAMGKNGSIRHMEDKFSKKAKN